MSGRPVCRVTLLVPNENIFIPEVYVKSFNKSFFQICVRIVNRFSKKAYFMQKRCGDK